jgi:hypothetical protein
MIRAKIGDLRKSDLGRITHQVADAAMKMSRRVVDVLSIPDADQIRYLGREQDTPVPPSDRASLPLRDYEGVVLGRSQVLQRLVGIVPQPRHAPRLV